MFLDIKKIDYWKILVCIVLLVLFFVFGIYVGRSTIKQKTETVIEYVQGEKVVDTVYFDRPYKIIEPIDTLDVLKGIIADGKFFEMFPEKVRDSIVYVTKEDTTKIMRDWATKREYCGVLFDNDYEGRFEYEIDVQYNKLGCLMYEFIPIEKVVTSNTVKVKKYSPFVGFGVSTDSHITGSVGMFINDSWGMSVNGRYNMDYQTIEYAPKYSVGLMVYKKF